MAGDPGIPVDPAKVTGNMFISDVVSLPEQTPLLRVAADKGCGFSRGIDMFNEELSLITDFWFNHR